MARISASGFEFGKLDKEVKEQKMAYEQDFYLDYL